MARRPAEPRRVAIGETLIRDEAHNRELFPELGDRSGARRRPAAARRSADDLAGLLTEVFGHPEFRPYQQEVCEAVAARRHALVVMPTGAGKSLCYQLPGLALEATTLVVSPLIALMEDQVAKLQELGLAAERIHSGRGREASRQACRDYLDGRLDFLFIAPERLSVRGFPEMLARRKPGLVAIDEAHCISHWGHDFRPDYRMLGERLPLLAPAPIVALTATATPRVQDDIVEQLGIPQAERSIHGFRRENIGVEVAELRPSARGHAVHEVLSRAERRPAIVYAPTRKEADSLGASLAATMPAAAYHAGLPADDRDRVQRAFQKGELEVIVATIAFGMGVDKPDVRSVIHTALPGSLEAYYQEIGRAGRDGLPSRAVLLCSWADRKTHEFFHRRNYPEPSLLAALYRRLGAEARPKDEVYRGLDAEPEELDRALEQLWIHEGARVDAEERVARGEPGWREPYEAQRDHRASQLDEVTRFSQTRSCRMVHLVRHFGDREDSGEPCGRCDVCAPEECLVHEMRQPLDDERRVMERIVAALAERDRQGTGQLFKEVASGGLDRRTFEQLLGGLARAGLVRVRADSFDKDGRTIHFQRASLTSRARRTEPDLSAVSLAEVTAAETAPAPARRRKKPAPSRAELEVDAPAALVEALKSWRLDEARKRRVPAFRILTDRVLLGVAVAQPSDEEELLAVRGIGPAIVRKYGERLLELVRDGG